MTVSTRISTFAVRGALVAMALMVTAPAMAGNNAPPSIVVPETAATHSTANTASSGTGTTETPGCNPVVKEAANRLAETKVALNRAISDEIIPQPISVLQQTCFDQAAAVSATTAAGIFSGSIMSEIQPIVGSALSSIYNDFQGALTNMFGGVAGGAIGNALGSFLGGFLGGGGDAQASYNCSGMQDTWDVIQNRGVVTSIGAPSLQKMLSGEAPSGGGEKFQKSWNAAQKNHVFSNAKTAYDALPKARIPSFKYTDSLCDAISKGGQNPGNCSRAK